MIEPPMTDRMGDWWATNQKIMHICTHCHKRQEEAPAVLRYNPALDPDGWQLREHPGWAADGFLAWWECHECGETVYEVVPRQRVLSWGKRLGGWKQMW